MKRERDVLMGAALLALMVALGLGQAALERTAVAQGVQAPMFELDPFLAEAAAEQLAARQRHWDVGRRSRPYLDRPPHGCAHRRRTGRNPGSADGRMLLASTARPRVRSGGELAESLGWTG